MRGPPCNPLIATSSSCTVARPSGSARAPPCSSSCQGLYHDYPWEQYRADALACAVALIDVGVRPGDRVGLLSENRLEWLVADIGLLAAGAVNVPPHAPLTARQIHFQLADAGVRWLFVSTRAARQGSLDAR